MKTKFNSLSHFIKNAETEVPFTYSGTMRFLRKNYPEKIQDFMKCFKNAFDNACIDEKDLDILEKTCLMEAIQKVNIEQ